MNLSGKANTWTKTILAKLLGTGMARLAFALVGLPMAVAIIVLLLLPEREHPPTYQRLQNALRWVEPLPPKTPFNYAGLQAISASQPDLSKVPWSTVTVPETVALPLGQARSPNEEVARAWFRFAVTVPDQFYPAAPLALYGTRVMASAYSVWVNGEPVYADLDDWRIQWNYPLFVQIPYSQLKAGQRLDIDLALPYQTSQGYALGSVYFGAANELRSLSNQRKYLQTTLPVVGMFLVGIMGVFSLLMWRKRSGESEHLWLALTAVFVVVCNIQFIYEFSYSDVKSAWYGSLVDAASSWICLTFFIFALRFNKLNYPKAEAALLMVTVANTVLTLPLWDWQVNALRLQQYITMVSYLQVLGIFTWLAVSRGRVQYILFCLAVWTLVITGFHDVTYLTSRTEPDQIFWFPYGAFMLFFLAEYLLQSRYLAALGQVEQNNQTLAATLWQREQELAAQQAVLLQAEKNNARLAERARLTQDIHDGIGSALTGTLIGLRSSNTTAAQAAQAVRECLDDIRIVMESLEPTAHDLTTLLGTLRQRFAGRLEATNLHLNWDIAQLPPLPWLDAPQALDILRAVQEIITNTLKHAHATQLRITAQVVYPPEQSSTQLPDQPPSQPSAVLLTLADNGQGFSQGAQPEGKGLGNIRTRLARVGAGLEVTSQPGQGVCYRISLPLELPLVAA
jgi:signal transduction histidine kinase